MVTELLLLFVLITKITLRICRCAPEFGVAAELAWLESEDMLVSVFIT